MKLFYVFVIHIITAFEVRFASSFIRCGVNVHISTRRFAFDVLGIPIPFIYAAYKNSEKSELVERVENKGDN